MVTTFMSQAIELAVENVLHDRGGPFAALIVKNGAVVAAGTNRVTVSNDPTAHAEVVAIRAACLELNAFQLQGCDIYTTCEPCPMCLGAIYWARLDRVYFAATSADAAAAGFDDSYIYRQIAIPFAERTIPMVHVPEVETSRPFRAWTRQSEKIPY
jgi:tRNA(Arg) A34 adenosine deaminase TadA